MKRYAQRQQTHREHAAKIRATLGLKDFTEVEAADDVLLDDLLRHLAQVSGAADLLLRISVYREPVDHSAVLFQAGQYDPEAEQIPGRQAASEHITGILAAAGITIDESFDRASVPAAVRAQLAPHLAEVDRPPVPPYRPVPGLPEQINVCQAASLLTVSGDGQEPRFFVHRWTATELAARAAHESGSRLVEVHQRAAGYWRWRTQVWPQDKAADVYDLLEARYHPLQAGDTEQAGRITEAICLQLQTWGAWDQEASLIHDTLARLPADSPRQAAWIHELAVLAQSRGDYGEAARQYQRSLNIDERLGDQAGMALSYHQLGILAQHRGDYDEATRQYQRALDIFERLGDQAGMASGYSQLGRLEADRGGPAEAVITWHVKALAIRLRLGAPPAAEDLRRLAACRRELDAAPFTSLLAWAAGDTDLAGTITSLLDEVDATGDGTA